MGTVRAALLATLVLAAGPAAGQLYHFGKNKVHYTRFDWQKLETPHFDVYFFPEEEVLASCAGHMAEEGYADLERKFGHTVQRRIPVIVYSSHIYFEQTNVIPDLLPEGVGGFTEFLKGRVALPLSGSFPEFERVLRHELVHVFMFDRIQQVLRRHGISEYRPGPLWFSEGLAEYWSGEWDRFADMVVRDALFAGQLVPIAHLESIYGTFQMYKEGQSICRYLATAYGADVFAVLFDNWWRSEDFGQVLQIATGAPLEKLDEQWQHSLRKTYLPDIERGDPPSQAARALTTVGYNLKPEVLQGTRADSLGVVFFSNQQGYTQIRRICAPDSERAAIVVGERASAFESLHPLSTKLAVSPDGRHLAFAAKRTGRDFLYLWDLGQSCQVDRFSFPEVVAIASPSFSPDGRKVVFSGADQGGFVDLYLVDLDSGQVRALTRDLYDDRDPDWSPDGTRIAFSSDRWSGGRQGHYSLFLYLLADDRIVQLTRGAHNDQQPNWSPRGDRLAFSSDQDTIPNIYLLQVEGDRATAIRQVTRVLTGAFDPAWVPDESGLLFSGFEAGRFQIYRTDLPAAGRADTLAPVPPDPGAAWNLAGIAGPASFSRSRYRKKLTLDIAQSQISQDPEFGTSGGVELGMSDMLGNDQYYFVLSHISGSNTGFFDGLNLAFARLHLGRQTNVTWGLFRLNDRLTSTFGRYVREKRTGGYVEVRYPFSLFKRLETSLFVRRAEIDRQFEGQRLAGWLVSNYLSYTYDNSTWIPTGPLEGMRFSLGMGQTVDWQRGRPFNLTFFGDYRHYLRMGRRTGLALRAMGRHSRGDVPEFFSMGGSWTLRGYPWRSIWGHNLVLCNQELRFPLLDRLVLAFPFGNLDLSAFRGALFVDAGNAWSEAFGRWKGGLGGGVRLALGGVFVFRLDGSRRTDFSSVGNDTHWDFFFGWDF